MKGTSFNMIVKEKRDDNFDLKETRSIPEHPGAGMFNTSGGNLSLQESHQAMTFSAEERSPHPEPPPAG